MPSKPIRAIYESGFLRLLEPVDLVEGQVVWVTILSEQDWVQASLDDPDHASAPDAGEADPNT